jgi:hypothetical protein
MDSKACDVSLRFPSSRGTLHCQAKRTPLHDAVVIGVLGVAQALVEAGADVNARAAVSGVPISCGRSDFSRVLTQIWF